VWVVCSSGAPIRRSDLLRRGFPGAIVLWADRLSEDDLRHRRYDEAFDAIDRALLATADYLERRTHRPDQELERNLSGLWMTASRAVAPLDPDFAELMGLKGLGWTNPRFWKEAEQRGFKIKLLDVHNARSALNRKRKMEPEPLDNITVAAPAHIHAGNPVLIVTLLLAGIFGVGCIVAGVMLMGALGSGETTFNFFGLQFTTKQAGVASIALGAAVIILTFRKVLKTVVELGRI
jgi:hypothetical protein